LIALTMARLQQSPGYPPYLQDAVIQVVHQQAEALSM